MGMSFEAYFADAWEVFPPLHAPRDGSQIIGCDEAGNVALVRFVDGRWARSDSGEAFKLFEWIPTIDGL